LLEFFKRRGVKTWHLVLLGDMIADKLREQIQIPVPEVERMIPAKIEIPKVEIPRPKVPELKLPEIVTKTVDKKDWIVSHVFNIVKISNVGGRLRELVVRSPSKNFSVHVSADGVDKISRSYEDLETISPHVETIDAYEEAGDSVYVLRIGEIRWANDFAASLYVDNGPITFNAIFACYDIYKLL